MDEKVQFHFLLYFRRGPATAALCTRGPWKSYRCTRPTTAGRWLFHSYLCTMWGVPSYTLLLFSLRSSGYQLGCTVAAVWAQWPVEHVKNSLQNIANEETPHIAFTDNRFQKFTFFRRLKRTPKRSSFGTCFSSWNSWRTSCPKISSTWPLKVRAQIRMKNDKLQHERKYRVRLGWL